MKTLNEITKYDVDTNKGKKFTKEELKKMQNSASLYSKKSFYTGKIYKITDKKMKTLNEIKKEAEDIMGQWNGDNAGVDEDNANIAGDILEAVKNLEELLAEII